jgi:hypothetical protein
VGAAWVPNGAGAHGLENGTFFCQVGPALADQKKTIFLFLAVVYGVPL